MAARDDSRDNPLRWKRRADSRLAVTAIRGNINGHKRRVRDGITCSLLDTQGAVKCLNAAIGLVLRDATHDDPRTRLQAGKLAIKVVQLAELLTREEHAVAGHTTVNIQGDMTVAQRQVSALGRLDALAAQSAQPARAERVVGGEAAHTRAKWIPPSFKMSPAGISTHRS